MEMNKSQLITPVAFIIFNRPKETQLVFNEIRKVKPLKLFIICDGPRINKIGEVDVVARVRSIVDKVDWNCEVKLNYSNINLGCKLRVSSGLNWVFENTDEAIILEDDCMPDISFFYYCQELLAKYRCDDRVMGITGDNFISNDLNFTDSYFFSSYMNIWGWATWRRAWDFYKVDIPDNGPIFFKNLMNSRSFLSSRAIKYWSLMLSHFNLRDMDTWDYQWSYAIWSNSGLVCTPSKNLISNIGFTDTATHTKTGDPLRENLPTSEMKFPLSHPNLLNVNVRADNILENKIFRIKPENVSFFYVKSYILNIKKYIFKKVKTKK